MLILQPPYMGIKTFLQVPHAPDLAKVEAQVGIIGFPYDLGVTNRPGARLAPDAIRKASLLLCEGFASEQVVDLGDLALNVQNFAERITECISKMLQKKILPLSLGGDHSITLPILRALARHYKKPIPLVHFDAHPDTWDENWGIEYGHGSFLYHALRENLVDGERSFLIGMRCPLDSKTWQYTRKHIKHIYPADRIHEQGLQPLLDQLALLQQEQAYLTFDIDVLDPAYAPGTGTPEVGGLTTWQIKKIFNAPIFRKIAWLGMDLVELCPPYDHAEITALAAAHTAYHFLNLCLSDEEKIACRFSFSH